jgi:aryl-alcohol dehydrogenase-like predicted oxidoreductase
LHCPPTATYDRPEIFELFDRLKDEGKIKHLGVSVEKVEEAQKAIQYSNVDTVQIIFNMFRHKPAEQFFGQASVKDIGIIARVPLASGLLSGKFTSNTQFGEGDHRNFNREGEVFDKGETFSGVPFEVGLSAVEKIRSGFPNVQLSHLALQWILSFEEVSCVIPGASNLVQLEDNLAASNAETLTPADLEIVSKVYVEEVKPLVHHLW